MVKYFCDRCEREIFPLNSAFALNEAESDHYYPGQPNPRSWVLCKECEKGFLKWLLNEGE